MHLVVTYVTKWRPIWVLITSFLANVNSCSCSLYVVVRLSVCLSSLCLSVCLSSVTFVHHTQPIEIFGNIFIWYERSFILVFWEEALLVGDDPFYVKFWVSRPPLEKIADFRPIFARSSSAITPSEKSSINTNRKSTTRFPISLRWSSYVAPKSPKRG